MRLAIVSPLPPAPTGIADYTMDVVRALRGTHSMELFHDQVEVLVPDPPAFHISELPVRDGKTRFDAIVYQMGNAPAHDFMYDWMERHPGIVVLHDLVLHHSYTRRFLESPESQAYAADPSSHEKRMKAEAKHEGYRSAIEAVYPGQGERLKDAHFNSTGDLLPYVFPLFEPSLIHARAAAAHNDFMLESMRVARPDLSVTKVAMPVRRIRTDVATVAALRVRWGIKDGDLVVGAFGLLTREKRIDTLARAFKRIAEIHPGARLLLAGPAADPEWLRGALDNACVTARTIVTGRLDTAEFSAAMELSTVVVHLRYPTARETSAALLRVMAQGRPVVISDIANQSEIPDDAVRRVDPTDEEGGVARAIDALARDPKLAQRLGSRAREFSETEHSDQRTLETYDRLLNSARPHYSHPSP
ncbi:MAG: glycosyltransferase [Vicinamibacteria bacterium]